MVAEIRYPVINDTPYIYFSYGATAGTGVYYHKGNIARVKWDGSGGEIIEDGGIHDADFQVNADGTIRELGESRISDAQYDSHNMEFEKEGNIYIINPSDGSDTLVLKKEDYASFIEQPTEKMDRFSDEYTNDDRFLMIEMAERLGERVYIRLNYCAYDSEYDSGWRPGARLEKGIMLEKDLTTCKASEIYSY